YEEHGDRVAEHLHGMFAMAIWDRRQRRLLLGRDRLGIKPLYYACRQHELIFASEIKAILAAGVKPVMNDAILPEFLATRYVSGEETFFQGVRKLSPAHTLTWSAAAGVSRRRYWHIPEPASDAAPARSFD